jgi:rhodanese-related sulfurtransferase
MKRIPAIIGLLGALLALLAACGSKPGSPGGYTNVSPAELKAMLAAKDFLLVNVHTPYEGEIDPTDAFIPYEASPEQHVDQYPADKSARIVLYCRSGRMSTTVAEALVKAGYTDVYNLDGGMMAWEASGYPLTRK